MSEQLRRFADALRARGCRVVASKATGLRAQCPVHRDIRPSLVVDERGGNLLVYCFAGCRTLTLLDALGLQWRDLRTGPITSKPTVAAAVVAAYDYADFDGTVYARKTRYVPKAFAWQRPDTGAPSGWRSRLDGIKPLPYGLEHIIDMRRVVVTEGEKAADELRRHGLTAIAPPSGASKWMEDWSEQLWRAGVQEVVVLPDADKPGRKHAQLVAASVTNWRPSLPVAAADDPWPDVTLDADDPEAASLTARVIDLPSLEPGEDVYDFLRTHGHSVLDLQRLIESAPVWAPQDPAERCRALTRARVAKHRARRRLARQLACPDLSRVTSQKDTRSASPSKTVCRDKISHSVTRYMQSDHPGGPQQPTT